MSAPTAKPARTERIVAFDTLRGFTIVSMVAFHATYDLAYIYGVSAPWFTSGAFQEVWRSSISWVFLFTAGWMCGFSRSNFKRGALYAAAALLVWAATSIAAVDTAVSFGIMYCMAACTLICGALQRLLARRRPLSARALLVGLAACLVLFALTRPIPRADYAIEHLAWLGFPSPSFTSGDYYPLIPFFFMYLAGYVSMLLFDRTRNGMYPAWSLRDWCPPLTRIGHLSLPIYLIHQPLLILVLDMVFGA